MVGTAPPAKLFCGAVPSRCFVIDENKLVENAAVLDEVQRETGAKILLALKGYAAWATFPLLSRAQGGPLYGVCASSVDEARLGKEKFGGEVHAFAAAWSEEEIRELLPLADHLVFNSEAQFLAFRPLIEHANEGFRRQSPILCGLRVNPEHSEGAPAIYNPCAPGSRLGVRPRDFARIRDLRGVSGLHFHALCEQDSPALEGVLRAAERKFPFSGMQWLNFGGGHHITRRGYNLPLLKRLLIESRERHGAQIYLEPGEAVALDAGWLTATVLDVVQADMPVAILDVSAACHMPDVLEAPYTPSVWHKGAERPQKALPAAEGIPHRLAGNSCLAGDVIGEYGSPLMLRPGERLVFQDMAIYSMVKTTTFNGLRLPSIGLLKKESAEFALLKKFAYEDFRDRLS